MHAETLASLVLAVVVSAGLAVVSHLRKRRGLFLIAKPLTTVLIGVGAALAIPPTADLKTGVLIALALSLVGDVCLMWAAAFTPGLLAFLAALLTYAWAFSLAVPWRLGQLAYLAAPAAVAAAIGRSLWPALGGLRLPVLVYMAALTLMVWRLLARIDAPSIPLDAWAAGAVGAFCFLTGDALLARRKFLGKAAPYAVELGVYYVAQGCLVAAAAL